MSSRNQPKNTQTLISKNVRQQSADVGFTSGHNATTARYTKSLSQPVMRVTPVGPSPAANDSESGCGKTSTKLSEYPLTYLGTVQLDRKITDKMLRWVLVDIKRYKRVNKRGLLRIQEANVSFISDTDSSDVILEHNVHSISQFSRCQRDRKCLFYLQRNNVDSPFVMFAFLCQQEDKVVDIFNSIQDAAKSTKKPDCISASQRRNHISKLFEVRYQGRIAISEKSKSGEFIDSWLLSRQARLLSPKDVARRGSYLELHSPRHRHVSDDIRTQANTADEGHASSTPAADSNRIRRLSEGDERERGRHDSSGSTRSATSSNRSEDNLNTIDSGVFDGDDSIARQNSVASTNSVTSDIFDEVDERDHRRSTLICSNDTNKTMLFQIDDDKTSIISLDKKSVILEKTHKEISYCTQGKQFSDHFGFISYDSRARKEGRRDQYIMYIFQCASDNVISEVMDTLRTAFGAVHKRNQELQNCDFCPMQQYHKLCEDLASNYNDLMNKVKTEQCSSFEDAADVLMTKLRIMCELRQLDHIHGKESDFNVMHGRHSKLNVLKNRAKKALVFDMFSKGKSQESEWRPRGGTAPVPELILNGLNDTQPGSPCPSPTAKRAFGLTEDLVGSLPSPGRPRSRTVDDIHKQTTTGSMPSYDSDRHTILRKITSMGHSLEEAIRGDKFHSPDKQSSHLTRKTSMPMIPADPRSPGYGDVNNSTPSSDKKNHRRHSSWRRGIFESVVTTPNSRTKRNALVDMLVKRSLGKEEIRAMWRSAIEQTILLNRMEKENTNLREHEEKMKQKRSQLDYEDITPCKDDAVTRWKSLLGKVKSTESDNLSIPKVDLWNLVKDGVPRARRGEIWQLLARQYNLSSKGLHNQAEERPTVEMLSYGELLRGLTPHQHAILIDLGRTFPQHDYFKMQLGAGQLALFNILKAYSLVDTEVGYCQGLGFVAGILLMHIDEEESFELLCHLMYDLGLRKLYKPNMAGLQVSMYQLARLMRDRHPALYQHLEETDVTPALYAAPWFITLFSSEFSIGFVSRVFDFLFMEGYCAIFKIALALLSVHEEDILAGESFECVTETLKKALPEMGLERMEVVFETANSLDLSNDLYTYQVEYHVMEEDLASSPDVADSSVNKLEQANSRLKEQNLQLVEKINTQTHKLHNQETMIDALQQSHAKLTRQVRSLEVERDKHLAMIERLSEFVPQHILKKLEPTVTDSPAEPPSTATTNSQH